MKRKKKTRKEWKEKQIYNTEHKRTKEECEG